MEPEEKEKQFKEFKKEMKKLSKETRCRRIAEKMEVELPSSYKENTPKEELVLEHVIQYRKEFSLQYDAKRELFLYPKNEFNKYKFICTTLRPTKIPYPELYDYKKCAKFISGFLEYEELNPPNEFPKIIPSPRNTIRFQLGDSFDFAIVLCSLLIGTGYNAYVVYGKAPRKITIRDESTLSCPDLDVGESVMKFDLSEKEEEFKPDLINEKEVIESKFDKDRQRDRIEKKKEEERKRTDISDDEEELEKYDEWKGERIHAWIFIKHNKRDKRLDRDIFIEPTTGRVYELKTSFYETIDAMFNNHNFWINIQPKKLVKDVDFNLKNKDFWEYVMLNYKEFNEEDNEDDPDQENEKPKQSTLNVVKKEEELEEILDMPPPWPEKLIIDNDDYENKTPLGVQTFYYKRKKIDKYAPYSQADGLVTTIYTYKDYGRQILDQVDYRYMHRTDKTYKIIKRPYDHMTKHYFLPGQLFAWKKVKEVEGEYREIKYYETNYDSGLVYRKEIFGKKIIHRYISRDDRVFERKAGIERMDQHKLSSRDTYVPNPNFKSVLIRKFTQKYEANPLLPPEGQIYRLVYLMDSTGTKIHVTYHYAKGKITAKTKEFADRDSENQIQNDEKEDIFEKYNNEDDKLEKKLQREKKDFLDDFKKIEVKYCENIVVNCENMKKILEVKMKNKPEDIFTSGILEKHLFFKALSSGKYNLENDTKVLSGENAQSSRIRYYVELLKKKKENDKNADFLNVKNDIIDIFKEEKLEITKILQDQLKEEFKNKENAGPREIEEHNEIISDIQRKIHIIYERAHKHVTNIMAEFGKLLEGLENEKF